METNAVGAPINSSWGRLIKFFNFCEHDNVNLRLDQKCSFCSHLISLANRLKFADQNISTYGALEVMVASFFGLAATHSSYTISSQGFFLCLEKWFIRPIIFKKTFSCLFFPTFEAKLLLSNITSASSGDYLLSSNSFLSAIGSTSAIFLRVHTHIWQPWKFLIYNCLFEHHRN